MYCYPRYHQLKKYVKTHVWFKICCPCQREKTKHSNTVILLKVMHSCLQKYSLFLSIRRHPFTAAQVLLRVWFFFFLAPNFAAFCLLIIFLFCFGIWFGGFFCGGVGLSACLFYINNVHFYSYRLTKRS